MVQSAQKNEIMPVICPHCNIPMVRVKVETWAPTNILLKQLQKIADHSGVRIYHCKSCGKVEFFRNC